jgi:hypothetical protein
MKRKKNKPLAPKFLWYWRILSEDPDQCYDGQATAYTKSEARAAAKRVLRLKRLPVGATVECLRAVRQFRAA